MNLSESFLAELKHEMASSRKVLARIPAEQLTWKPHEKSMSLGQLAAHVAEIPRWWSVTMTTSEFDYGTMDYKPFVATSAEDLVQYLDESEAMAAAALENVADETFDETWAIKYKGNLLWEMPRKAVLRREVGHIIHHRGQLTVYLRMLDVPLPNLFGPTADER